MSAEQRARSRGRAGWRSRAGMLGALTSLVLAGCIDLGQFERRIESMCLDMGTWSAGPCGDLDGDGYVDVVLYVDASPDPKQFLFTAWVLSGRDLSVKFRIEDPVAAPGTSLFWIAPIPDADGTGGLDLLLIAFSLDAEGGLRLREEAAVISGRDGALIRRERFDPSEGTIQLVLTEPRQVLAYVRDAPEQSSWNKYFFAERLPRFEADPADEGTPRTCGDLDGDGVIDSMTLCDKPIRVRVVSGHDELLLREFPISDSNFATAATGSAQLGDVDGDGTADLLVGAQVSISEERLSPRRCELGLLSIVSGADSSVLHALDRERLLASDVVKNSLRSK